MARNEHTANELEAIAGQLLKGVENLKATVDLMRESQLPHALIHGSAPKNLYLPAVLDWIEKAHSDVKIQIRAYLSGSQSQAEFLKQKNENQKKAAAKKPWKKPAKKKAT